MIGQRHRATGDTGPKTRAAERLRRNAVMGVHALGLVLMCVTIGVPTWGETDAGYTYGLWKACISLPKGTECYDMKGDIPKSLKISRAFLCLSVAVGVVGAALAFIVMIKELLPDYSRIILALVLVITGIFAIVGVGVMGGVYMDDDETRWCLPLAIMAALLFLINGLSVPKVIKGPKHGSVTKVAPQRQGQVSSNEAQYQQQMRQQQLQQQQHHQQHPPAYADTNLDYNGYNQAGHNQGYNQGYSHTQSQGYNQGQQGYHGQTAEPGYYPDQYGDGGAHQHPASPPPAYS